MAFWSLDGLSRNESCPGDGRASGGGCGWHGESRGQGGQGLGGEVSGGDRLEQVVDGAGEPLFGGGFGFAADRELAEPHVVLEVAMGCFGDVAALPVGGDPLGAASRAAIAAVAGPPRAGGPVSLPSRAACSRLRCLPVAMRRSGPGMVRLCSEQSPASAGNKSMPSVAVPGGGAGGGDEGGGGFGVAEHRLEPFGVGGVAGELGGDDQVVLGCDVLGVVALEEPAAAHRHQPRVHVGDVAHRRGALLRGGLAPRFGSPGLGPASAARALATPAWALGVNGLRPPGSRLIPAAASAARWACHAATLACCVASARSSRTRAAATAAAAGCPGGGCPDSSASR